MKKPVALILLLIAWYFAGMHQQSALMAAVICALILTVCNIIFVLVMKPKITPHIPPQENRFYKNTESALKLTLHNAGSLPVNRVRIRLSLRYMTEKRDTHRKLNAAAAARSDTEAELYFSAPYCGMISARLSKVQVYDYFSFFSAGKKLSDQEQHLYIYPQPKELRLIMPPFGAYTAKAVADSSSDRSGDDHSEIRLVREYRDGDLIRHMHRNYSAKTEKLWIKEYNKENDYIFDLFLDTSDSTLTTEILDALYELVCSITSSLVKMDVIIRLQWYDRNINGMHTVPVSDEASLEEALPLLYRSDLRCTREEFNAADTAANGMVINSRLEWYFLGQHVFTFTPDNLENELFGNVFDLRR